MDQDMKLDQALRQAGEKMEFRDGSAARVWVRATRTEPKRVQPARWLVPMAAALTVIVTLAAVPEARAAVGSLLGRLFSVSDYMAQDTANRPENSAVAGLVQPGSSADPAAKSLDGNEWIGDVKVKILETLYDGEYVYVKYTVDSSGVEHMMGGYDALTPGQNVGYKQFRAGSVTLPDQSTLQLLQGGEQDMGGGTWMDVAKYEAGTLRDHSGKINLVFTVQFSSIVDGAGACAPAGDLTLPFTLDLDAGNSSVAQVAANDAKEHLLGGSVIVTDETEENGKPVLTNRQLDLSGSKLIVESVVTKPTETGVTLRLVPNEALAAMKPFSPKQFFLSAVLMDGSQVVGEYVTANRESDGSYRIELAAPLLSKDVKTLTLKASFLRVGKLNGQEMAIDQPFALGDSWENDSVPQEIEGGTFEIKLQE